MGLPDFRAIREQCEQIRAQKETAFPKYSMVRVASERFHGIGIVADSDADGCPLEKLAVRVESLNIWWYPIEDCQPYRGKMPSWIRSFFRQHNIKRVDAPKELYPSCRTRRNMERGSGEERTNNENHGNNNWQME